MTPLVTRAPSFSDMLAEIMDVTSAVYQHGRCSDLFVDGMFDRLVTVARELPTSHFYGRRFGFQVTAANCAP